MKYTFIKFRIRKRINSNKKVIFKNGGRLTNSKIHFKLHSPVSQPMRKITDMLSSLIHRTDKDFVCTNSFHESISSVLVVAQCLAMLPVMGVKNASTNNLKFKWQNFRTIYSMFTCGFAASYLILTIYAIFNASVTFNSFVQLIFFTTTTFGVLSFILLAQKWPKLMQHWVFVESILPCFNVNDEKKRLRRKIRFISIIVLSVALAEHVLNNYSTVINAIEKKHDPWQTLFEVQLPLFFGKSKISWWKAIFSKWLVMVVTFSWSFMDLFVIIISVGLTSLFKRLNADLKRVKGQNTTNEFWQLHRIQYRKIVHLVDTVDDAISTIVIVAFANNLFFICVQIVRSIKPMPSFINKLYFWFSLVFLISRTFAVSLYASYVHDESKKPYDALCNVPRYSWCIEAYRFSEELVNETVALTGMKLFYLTRRLILTVAGTILTYELVLLQINTDI